MHPSIRWSLAAALVASAPAHAQPAQPEEPADARMALFNRIQWQDGPTRSKVGPEAEMSVPRNCRFTDAEGARLFMEVTENPTSGQERGVLLCQTREDEDTWFVVFSFDPSGLVRDDDRGELDADQILKSIREGTEQSNEERRRRGWETIEISGWSRPPYYDQKTNNLTWAVQMRSGTVNHSVRLLGRGGVMHADLVAGPEQLPGAVSAFDGMLTQYAFSPGHKYAEWREGDKLAGYGLTALVAGGAGAVAVKTGLFGKLWKVIAAVAVAAMAKIGSLFGRRKDS